MGVRDHREQGKNSRSKVSTEAKHQSLALKPPHTPFLRGPSQSTTHRPVSGAIASSEGTQLVCRLPLAALHSLTRNGLSWRPDAVLRYGLKQSRIGAVQTKAFSGCGGHHHTLDLLKHPGADAGTTMLSKRSFPHVACPCSGPCPGRGVNGGGESIAFLVHSAGPQFSLPPLQDTPSLSLLSRKPWLLTIEGYELTGLR